MKRGRSVGYYSSGDTQEAEKYSAPILPSRRTPGARTPSGTLPRGLAALAITSGAGCARRAERTLRPMHESQRESRPPLRAHQTGLQAMWRKTHDSTGQWAGAMSEPALRPPRAALPLYRVVTDGRAAPTQDRRAFLGMPALRTAEQFRRDDTLAPSETLFSTLNAVARSANARRGVACPAQRRRDERSADSRCGDRQTETDVPRANGPQPERPGELSTLCDRRYGVGVECTRLSWRKTDGGQQQ